MSKPTRCARAKAIAIQVLRHLFFTAMVAYVAIWALVFYFLDKALLYLLLSILVPLGAALWIANAERQHLKELDDKLDAILRQLKGFDDET